MTVCASVFLFSLCLQLWKIHKSHYTPVVPLPLLLVFYLHVLLYTSGPTCTVIFYLFIFYSVQGCERLQFFRYEHCAPHYRH